MEQFMALQEALARMSAGKTKRTRESVQGDIDFHNRILDISATSFWPAYAISAWYRWS
ncbi:MAG: hypothetical protein JKP90_20620 [Desulfofustis sp. PB-SRB1]|nr:hypothetical protein [Desulfofustis sp. PB-SRB1]